MSMSRGFQIKMRRIEGYKVQGIRSKVKEGDNLLF